MDIQKYTRVMQTIKGRKEHIDWIMDNAESMGKVSTFMIESICLQLRMMIEDIAVACVIANAEEMPELARGLRGEYRPTLILKGLERINPQCYPTPIVENVEGPQGHFRDTHNRPEGDWLTRAEAVVEYGRLSNVIHRNLKAYNGKQVGYPELYQQCGYLEYKIRNLLSQHHITVLNEDTMYRVLMSGSGVDDNGVPFEGRIQVAPFMSIPKGMEEAALKGEISVDDIAAAYEHRPTNTA